MNFSAKTGSPGFTLLEMIIALFILMLVLGMAVMATRNVFADEDLRQASRKLQVFAKTARKQACLEGRPWEIVFKPGLWLLKPAAGSGTGEPSDLSPADPEPVEYRIPATLRWKIKIWGSKAWETPKETSWIFTSTGLCAPNRFRLERGDSWMELSFNSLTANAQDEEFYLP